MNSVLLRHRSPRTLPIMILSVAAFILLCTIIYSLIPGKPYTFYVDVPAAPEAKVFHETGNEAVMVESLSPYDEDTVSIQVRAVTKGREYIYVDENGRIMDEPALRQGEKPEFGRELPEGGRSLYIDPFGNIVDMNTGNFAGCEWVLFSTALFVLSLSCICLIHARSIADKELYSYRMVFLLGISIFLLGVFFIYVVQWVNFLRNPATASMAAVLEALADAGWSYMRFSLPFLISFSAAMTISNISLIRHEGRRFKNILGMLVGLVMLLGVLIGYLLNSSFSQSFLSLRAQKTLFSLYTSAFVYLECMLIGTILCAVMAANHVPDPDKDYLIILGCGFAPDGHLYPLLKGRVDAAIHFWHSQRKLTGREAAMVPSGGQGPNETMAEAEAMRRYLLLQGFSDELIVKEDRSTNTFQNMQFSKELIDGIKPGAKAAFFTTNYHVFRSGILSVKTGLKADGMGSRTKWYFWPNAFVREFIGLMVNEIRWQLGILLVMTGIFAAISSLLV